MNEFEKAKEEINRINKEREEARARNLNATQIKSAELKAQEIEEEQAKIQREARIKANAKFLLKTAPDLLKDVNQRLELNGTVYGWRTKTVEYEQYHSETFSSNPIDGYSNSWTTRHKQQRIETRLVIPKKGSIYVCMPLIEGNYSLERNFLGNKKFKWEIPIREEERWCYISSGEVDTNFGCRCSMNVDQEEFLNSLTKDILAAVIALHRK